MRLPLAISIAWTASCVASSGPRTRRSSASSTLTGRGVQGGGDDPVAQEGVEQLDLAGAARPPMCRHEGAGDDQHEPRAAQGSPSRGLLPPPSGSCHSAAAQNQGSSAADASSLACHWSGGNRSVRHQGRRVRHISVRRLHCPASIRCKVPQAQIVKGRAKDGVALIVGETGAIRFVPLGVGRARPWPAVQLQAPPRP